MQYCIDDATFKFVKHLGLLHDPVFECSGPLHELWNCTLYNFRLLLLQQCEPVLATPPQNNHCVQKQI